MTRREILEKNWKDFRLSTGLEYEPMSDKAYEFMENAMEQYAELRLGAVVGRSELLMDFIQWKNKKDNNWLKHIYDKEVDDYLKSINCR